MYAHVNNWAAAGDYFVQGKCQRTNPPCKYLHPPSHLQEQLLQTGKQNLAMKNLQAVAVSGLQPMLQMPNTNPAAAAAFPMVSDGVVCEHNINKF